jgi:tetratricopeptide (TPR) repeat protein
VRLIPRRGELSRACDLYGQYLALMQENRNLSGEAIALSNLGLVHADRGDLRQAIVYYDQALSLSWCWNLGLAYEAIDNDQYALELMQITVEYQLSINHLDAQKNLHRLEQIWYRISGASE